MTNCDIAIIGGGPAGLAAAIEAYDSGVKYIIIFEREDRLGGILNQCIHNGFGLTRFKESLSGPEYASRFITELKKREIKVLLETTVLSISQDKKLTAINSELGLFNIEAKSIILAMGCRERSRGALNIAGSRPAGIYSAGTAQKYVNVKGYLPGKDVVILGSGDIGLIMARRMTLEGAKVHAVFEIMPYSSGLKRNIVQCLDDFNIPLYLNHTIVKICGKERVEGVYATKVDENKKPISGTEIYIPCDTVLFSVGLIPENELTKNAGIDLSKNTKGAVVDQNRQTSCDGIFSCGNVLQVHDLVDFVSEEAEIAGRGAASYVKGELGRCQSINCINGKNINYVLPQKIKKCNNTDIKLFFRVSRPLNNCVLKVVSGDSKLYSIKKRVVTPGEMQTIILKSNQIENLNTDVIVSLEESND